MYDVDPRHTNLARAYLEDPFGRHPPEVQRLLNRLRLPGARTWVVAICDDGRLALARVRPMPEPPELLDGAVYLTVADAARALFFLQWEQVTGEPLALPRPERAPGPPPRLPDKTVAGYADRLSAAPGDTLTVRVHVDRPGMVTARLVRLSGAANFPNRTTLVREPVRDDRELRVAAGPQQARPGSYVLVETAGVLSRLTSMTLQVAVRVRALVRRPQALLGTWGVHDRRGAALGLDEHGNPCFHLGGRVLTISDPLTAGVWTVLSGTYDAASGRACLRQVPLARAPGERVALAPVQVEAVVGHGEDIGGSGSVLIAAWRGRDGAEGHLDGRLARPRIVDRVVGPDELDALHRGDDVAGVVAAWDFGAEATSARVVDAGPHRLHGQTVQGPLRGVAGPAWSGRCRSFVDAPGEYDAIEFHADDLADAGWEPSCEVRLPDELDSGVYAVELDDGTSRDEVVVFVRPRPDVPPARVAFLAPTASYLAYGSYRLVEMGAGKMFSEGSVPFVTGHDVFVHRHPELGGSTYDFHADGTGIHHSSRLRPLANVRPGASLWGLTGFPADTHITAWLEHAGERFDVLTDDDLHAEGVSLLAPYRVVVTGNHPEYWSTRMLDALEAYLDCGGRLVYLGGNGFYWRVAFGAEASGLLEVRRGEFGTGAWHDEPGEDHLAATGEAGGLWLRHRRPPHALVGVGFAAQGFDAAAPYRVRPGARSSRAAWILEGVDADVLGDHGAVGGGAAGWEIDRADPALGTPPHAVVLASSFGHTATYRHVIEELPLNLGFADGVEDPNVRADVVFFETPAGGAVFSVGSMTWATSLADGGYGNDVARVTTNVLRRFVDPAPFAPR